MAEGTGGIQPEKKAATENKAQCPVWLGRPLESGLLNQRRCGLGLRAVQSGKTWWEVVSRHPVGHTAEPGDQAGMPLGKSLLDGWPGPPGPHRWQSLGLPPWGLCSPMLGARLNPPRLLLVKQVLSVWCGRCGNSHQVLVGWLQPDPRPPQRPPASPGSEGRCTETPSSGSFYFQSFLFRPTEKQAQELSSGAA